MRECPCRVGENAWRRRLRAPPSYRLFASLWLALAGCAQSAQDGAADGAVGSGAQSGGAGTQGAGVQGDGGETTATGGEGGGDGDASLTECQPNPDASATDCPTLCPERCNGLDDDCDGDVDERDADAACNGPHGAGACLSGFCVLLACEDDYRDCDTRSANGCEAAIQTDVDHCGACGHACNFGRGSGRCEAGECVLEGCWSGYGDCDLDPENGCEQPLTTLAHCGGCNAACMVGGGNVECSVGTCVVLGCPDGTADCDFDPDTACESLDDPAQCGACNMRCDAAELQNVASAECDAAECVLTCGAGFDDCDGDAANGCETALVSLQHCGGCGMACQISHAVAECSSGSCRFVQCAPGFDDCDGDPDNGCEQRLDSLSHCGACAAVCDKLSCEGGVCTAVQCAPPAADCDGDEVSCEVDLSSDPSHCGACGTGCGFSVPDPHAGGAACQSGSCVPGCDAGWDDCDLDPKNGCETSLTGLSSCGQCGATCSIAHASATCASGECRVAQCAADWADCDADGLSCERAIDTPEDCGACGSACDIDHALAACGGAPGARACTINRCDPGYGDCDLDPGNGCERSEAVLGPCSPDDTCTRVVAGPNVYHVCQNPRAFAAARQHCRLQLGGDLVRIDDGAENGLIGAQLGGETWIGGSATGHPRTFVWVRDGVPFHTDGAPVGGYGSFAGGQPDGAGDCVSSDASGRWRDRDCGGALPYVCEEAPDGCPGDGNKRSPGQCGCGVPDVDGDGDGFAACNEACDGDPNKTTAGACGCGVADTDSDMDGTPDCTDGCDADPDKTAAGICGCGVPDVDGDGDGFAACDDACDGDPAKTAAGVCGCGMPDVDTDGDGFEDCIESCDGDPDKQDPGGCGCGVADTDTDGDGAADCVDGCAGDPGKTAPGVCGCNVADADSDGDGTPDCHDGCPADVSKLAPGDCGCSDSPVGAGGACDDGPCRAATSCDGAGACGPVSCPGAEKRKLLTVRSAQVNANLVDFPVLVKLSDADLAAARADGGDIYFTDLGDAVLDFEIEDFQSGGDLVAWVRVPGISSSMDTGFRLYYGSGLSLGLEDSSGVWTNGFAAVFHMDYGGGAGTQNDSTANANHLTPSSVNGAVTPPTDSPSGRIGHALSYVQASASCLARPSTASTNLSGTATVQGWVKLGVEPAQNYNESIVGHRGGTNNNYQFYYYRNSRKLRFWGDGVESADASVGSAEGSWAHVVGVVDSGAQTTKIYVDGVLRDTLSGTRFNASGVNANTEFYVGCIWHQASMNGELDEVRLSNTGRSPAWIAAEYANQRPGSDFIAVGAETTWNAP